MNGLWSQLCEVWVVSVEYHHSLTKAQKLAASCATGSQEDYSMATRKKKAKTSRKSTKPSSTSLGGERVVVELAGVSIEGYDLRAVTPLWKQFLQSLYKGVHGEVSWKRIGFVLITLVCLIGPTMICLFTKAPWSLWFDFYKFIGPAAFIQYGAGKWVDHYTAQNQRKPLGTGAGNTGSNK